MLRFCSSVLLFPIAFAVAQTVSLTPEPPKTGASVPGDRVVLTVGSVRITAAQFEQLVQTLAPQSQANARGAGRKQYADNLVKALVLAEEGRRRKLDETPEFKILATIQNANLLARRTYEQIQQQITPDEAEMRKYFDEHRSEFEQVQARHILVRMQGSPVPIRPGQKDLTDAEALAKAEDLRQRHIAGQAFDALARAESDDTTSGSNGGDLGFFRRNQMVPAFDEAAFKLKPGEISEPVKSQFGYHLIKVDARRDTFEDVKGEVERRLKPEMAQKALKDLEEKGKPVYDPEFFNLPKQ